jgi:LSD1 subclass zinc finger protein
MSELQDQPDVAGEDGAVDETGDRFFACGQCGAELAYEPGTSTLTCAYCSHVNEIPESTTQIEELDYRSHLDALAAGAPVDEERTILCDSCGVLMQRPPGLDAFNCPYCGAGIVTEETTTRLIRPRAVLPFKLDRDEARGAFRRWIGKLWFAPSDLKRYAESDDRLRGVYVPYWTYDCRTVTEYTGQRGEDYWDTQRYTTTVNGKRVTKTRRVRKTRWYPASGTVHDAFDDLLVLASVSLPAKRVHALTPWDLSQLEPYADEYLAGFDAEKYQVGLDDGFEVAKEKMVPVIRGSISSDIGGDRQRRPDADRAQRHRVQAHPAAGLGQRVPLPGTDVPDPDQRGDRRGPGGPAVERDEDRAGGGGGAGGGGCGGPVHRDPVEGYRIIPSSHHPTSRDPTSARLRGRVTGSDRLLDGRVIRGRAGLDGECGMSDDGMMG